MARYSTKIKQKQKPKPSLMPIWLSLIGVALILFAGWAIWSSNAQSKATIEVKGAPRLKVDKEKIDHGDLKLGNPVKDEIRVTNVGDQPLSFAQAPYVEVKEGC